MRTARIGMRHSYGTHLERENIRVLSGEREGNRAERSKVADRLIIVLNSITIALQYLQLGHHFRRCNGVFSPP